MSCIQIQKNRSECSHATVLVLSALRRFRKSWLEAEVKLRFSLRPGWRNDASKNTWMGGSICLKPRSETTNPEKESRIKRYPGASLGDHGFWSLLIPFCQTLGFRNDGHGDEHDRKLTSGKALKGKGLCGLDLPCLPLGKCALQP